MRAALAAVVLVALAPGAAACGQDCTAIGVPGLHVVVQTDAGAPICDAVVSIVDDDAVEQPEVFVSPDGSCSWTAAWGRSGTFDVRAVHGGVELRQEAKVTKGACHVKTAGVMFTFAAT
ncbi:MAG: hypothetical protein QM733_12290 [Ilumatobacteraceae bacterium]